MIVVAPAEAHSGCSHRVTTNALIRVHAAGPNRFAVEATPADCVRVAFTASGRRRRGCCRASTTAATSAADVHHSGTVAAVREAVLHGWTGAAFSQYKRKGMPIDWEEVAADWLRPVLRDLIARPSEAGDFWNVNLPHLEPGARPPESRLLPPRSSSAAAQLP